MAGGEGAGCSIAPGPTGEPSRLPGSDGAAGAGRMRRWWPWARRVLAALTLAAGLYALWDQRGIVAQAAALSAHLRLRWVVVAAVAEMASMVLFARLQRWLLRAGGREFSLASMLQITLAGNSMAVSLPGGVAWSAGFAVEQLHKRGASRPLTVWVLLAAGALSSFALFLILVAGVELAGNVGPGRDFRLAGLVLASIPVLVGLGAFIWARSAGGRRLLAWLGSIARHRLPGGERLAVAAGGLWEKMRAVQPKKREWLGAFALAMGVWLDDAFCLVAVILALGAPIPWPGILVAYGIAQIGASLPITPGGLGVVEGSLSYALIVYGMPAKDAVAAVLIYRALSFWALVPIGWGAFLMLQRSNRHTKGSGGEKQWALNN